MIWSTLEFPSFNFNSILDGFCILKGMSYMMPLSRHALSLQTGLHRLFILGTVILPTPAQTIWFSQTTANSPTVRVHPRLGAYVTSRYLQSSDISTRGHSRGTGPC